MSDKLQKDLQQVILCDMCTEEDRKPARKTCMKCEISMCVQHLQAHLTTPVLLQTHPLTEPTSACGTTKCPQHGKLLEYYCLDDMTSVCVSCAIEDQHRLHNMKTFSTAHKELMENLKAKEKALVMKTSGNDLSLEKWEKGEGEKLSRSSVSLIDAVTQLRDRVLTSIRSSVSARMVSIKTSQSSMQAAQREKDTFRFLQMYSQVHQDLQKTKAVDLRKGLEPGSERDKLIQEIRHNGEQMLDKAEQFLGSLLTLVDPENHQELFATSSDLIFEQKDVYGNMSLSKDKRKVFCNSSTGQYSATLMIRSTQTKPNQSTVHRPDHQRWVLSFSEEFDWTVGLRVENYANNMQRGPVYSLCCKDNQLSKNETLYDDQDVLRGFAFGANCVSTSVSSTSLRQQWRNGDEVGSKPQMVEVLLNLTTSSLSFSRRTGRHQRKKIISMKTNNSHSLHPFVQLMKKNAQTAMFGTSGNCYVQQQHNSDVIEVACELI